MKLRPRRQECGRGDGFISIRDRGEVCSNKVSPHRCEHPHVSSHAPWSPAAAAAAALPLAPPALCFLAPPSGRAKQRTPASQQRSACPKKLQQPAEWSTRASGSPCSAAANCNPWTPNTLWHLFAALGCQLRWRPFGRFAATSRMRFLACGALGEAAGTAARPRSKPCCTSSGGRCRSFAFDLESAGLWR